MGGSEDRDLEREAGVYCHELFYNAVHQMRKTRLHMKHDENIMGGLRFGWR